MDSGSKHNNQSGCKRKAVSDLQTYPKRNLHKLFSPSITYRCAVGSLPPSTNISSNNTPKPCVPCAYKICNFDIALDTEFTKTIPNQRPEQCPRSSNPSNTTNNNNNINMTMGYKRGMNVLTVGDGDFTFSLAVARLVLGNNSPNKKKKKKQKGMVITTSYEDYSTLCKVYPDFDSTLESLKSCSGGIGEGENVIIGYNVDATRLNDTLPKGVVQHQSSNNQVKFHRIVWNFPCTAITSGQDGQNDAMEENKELVRKFVANALSYLHDDGEIHMCHKTKPPYNHWGLEKVALEGITTNDNERQFEYKGRIVLDKCTLPPYTPRKALDKKSFPCHDACFYVFGWRRHEDEEVCQSNATIPDNDNEQVDSAEEQSDLSSIIKVTEKVVETIRSTHLSLKRKQGSNKSKSSSKWNGKNSNKRRRK